MEQPPTVKCNTHCNPVLSFLEACPYIDSDRLDSSWEYSLQIYMIIVTCIPHTLIAICGLCWILSKLSYIPFSMLSGLFIVISLSHPSQQGSSRLMKDIFRMARPNSGCCKSYGMPSSHAAIAVFLLVWLSLSLMRTKERPKSAVILLALYAVHVPVILYSRIYLTYHYPSQVIVGVVYGALVALVASYLSSKTQLGKVARQVSPLIMMLVKHLRNRVELIN